MHLIFEDFLTSHRPDTLILSARWMADDIPALERTVSALQGRAGRIVVFGPIVEYQQPLPRLLAQVSTGRSASLIDEARLQAGAQVDRKLAEAVEGRAQPTCLFATCCVLGPEQAAQLFGMALRYSSTTVT